MTNDSLLEISFRTNILHKKVEKKEVIIYEDHRTILNVLYHLITVKSIDKPLNLIMFDRHDDFCDINIPAKRKINSLLKNFTKEKLLNYVEFELSILDDDWVKAGMELNLINDCVLFNSESSITDKADYKTKRWGVKKMYNVGNVWSAIGHQGCLNDSMKSVQYHDLWDALDWEYKNYRFQFKDERKKYVFDLDLDCFTTEILDETVAIREDILINRFKEYYTGNHKYPNALLFVKDLIDRAEIVTICLESGCCGGIREAQKIFNTIDYLFFDNELGK